MGPRVCLILLAVLHYGSVRAVPRPNNGLQECRVNPNLLTLEVLPGGGWDNLQNRDMGRVMNFTYSQCQTTEDGIYLIPNEVFVIPQKNTHLQKGSEVYEHWLDYQSSTSLTINADVTFKGLLNGKFSVGFLKAKSYQVRDDSVTTHVEVRNHMYTVNTHPDFTLDSRFTQQVEEIAEALLNNNTRHATFLSEMMVAEYGTHVITSVDAGAILEQEDYVKSSYYHRNDISKISTSAGINFLKAIEELTFGTDSSNILQTNETLSYMTNLTHSIMQSHGGTTIYPGITLKTWQESTINNLVAIDRIGLPLHYILNGATLPDLSDGTLTKVVESVRRAIQNYYNINKRPGCVDRNSPNFNFQANVDDNSCVGPAMNLSLGGIYQTCTQLTPDAAPLCAVQEQKNPDSGNFSCREPYISTFLQATEVEEIYSELKCRKKCKKLCIFRCCKTTCGVYYHVRRAKVKTFWCATNQLTTLHTGYLFGGLYSPSLENPLTRSKGCPAHYIPFKFLSSGSMVCLSKDFEQTSLSVPFGGFFSCISGNPLAGTEYRCPPGFSQHLAEISDGCQILYCVKSGAFTAGKLQPIRLPPFSRPPLIKKVDNKTRIMISEGDQVWLRKGDSKSWQRAKSGEWEQYESETEEPSIIEWVEIATGIIIVLFFIFLAFGIVFIVRRKTRSSSRR